METIKICPNCRKPLPPDVPLGLCPECLIKSGFPTGTEPGAAGEVAAARFVPPPVAEIAQLFPQLEILRLIGQGGMGAVYKARQPTLDRFVALKVLPPALGSDPGFAERFNREARALARLNHPNIVAVHDFGKSGPLHYLIMEFVDGTNLREVERSGQLTPEQALAIVPQICEALQFAHNEGIVHRDIKPENLLLDKKGRLKITDFGIAKLIGVPAGKLSLTGVKDIVGTPHYMAPEQIERPQSVDHRADIYSLGVVFYEMLTGELPLGKFSPPSQKVSVDVRLDEVVLRALEKEPSRRYQQISQVKTDVETIAGTTLQVGEFAARGGRGSLSSAALDREISDKAIVPAFLLAFFFGVFGAHRFYVGRIRTGCLQLALFALFVLLIIICATAGHRAQPLAAILLGFAAFGAVVWTTIDWVLIIFKAFTDGQGRRINNWFHAEVNVSTANRDKGSGTPPASPSASTPVATPPGQAAPAVPAAAVNLPVKPGGKIVAPAVGLLVAAALKLLSSISLLGALLSSGHPRLGGLENILDFGGLQWGVGERLLTGVGVAVFMIIPAVLVMFAGLNMMQLRSHGWAVAGAILAIVLPPWYLVGVPVGIWALIALSCAGIRELFTTGDRQQPPPINLRRWIWGTAAILGMVAFIGLAVTLATSNPQEPWRHGVGSHRISRAEGEGNQTGEGTSTAPATEALESVSATPAAPAMPVRIKAGSSDPFTDSDGNVWLPDQGFSGGDTSERDEDLPIANTTDPGLYRSERFGMTAFSYPLPDGRYLVKLHFAETYDDITGPGERVFSFSVQGVEFKDFDVWAKAGGGKRAYIETVVAKVTDGKLNIRFFPKQDQPEINGIEILPATPLAAPPTPQTSPAPIALPAPPRSPAPPAPNAVTPQPPSAGETSGDSKAQPERIIAPLTCTDPFKERFDQTFPLSADGRVRLDNIDGRVEIAGWDRDDVTIQALKHGKSQKIVESTLVKVVSSPDEISIHTESAPGKNGIWSILSWLTNWGEKTAKVDYAIQVPRHARLANIACVNGPVEIDDVRGNIDVSTVNGGMNIQDAAGNLKLSTVNGIIKAVLASLGGSQSVSVSSVSGSIELILPATADAKVSADTINGGISSDFPGLVSKKEFPLGQSLKGTLGKGSARVKTSTLNGAIHFKLGKDAI